jgi:flagellar hook-associated protein 3 FlgL
MRVTNALVTRDTIARLQENQRRVAEAQERVSSGKRITKMSDDPTGASAVMQASGSLRAIDQYRRNVQSVGSRLAAEEAALDQVTQLMTRAREIGVGQATATSNAQSRLAAAAEVKQLLQQAIQIANTKFGDDYLFGGASSATSAPFDAGQTGQAPRFVSLAGAPATPRLPQGVRSVEVGAGQTMAGVHDGDTAFVQTGVLDGLADLQAALEADDTDAIGAAMNRLDLGFTDVQTLIGDVGARQNNVDLIASGFDALQLTLEERKGDLSEVEMEQAITEMLNRQTAYQAAMLASSKVIGMSLTDYLR